MKKEKFLKHVRKASKNLRKAAKRDSFVEELGAAYGILAAIEHAVLHPESSEAGDPETTEVVEESCQDPDCPYQQALDSGKFVLTLRPPA